MRKFGRTRNAMPRTSIHESHQRLLTVADAAWLVGEPEDKIRGWIAAAAIPYVESPSVDGTEHAIPMHGLLRSLARVYDLADWFRRLSDAVADGPQVPAAAPEQSPAEFALRAVSVSWRGGAHGLLVTLRQRLERAEWLHIREKH
jgi:hypothetical protein